MTFSFWAFRKSACCCSIGPALGSLADDLPIGRRFLFDLVYRSCHAMHVKLPPLGFLVSTLEPIIAHHGMGADPNKPFNLQHFEGVFGGQEANLAAGMAPEGRINPKVDLGASFLGFEVVEPECPRQGA